jgi:hypothetical protein
MVAMIDIWVARRRLECPVAGAPSADNNQAMRLHPPKCKERMMPVAVPIVRPFEYAKCQSASELRAE